MKVSEIHRTNVSPLVVLALVFLIVSCNSTGEQNEKSPDYPIMVVKPGSKTLETNYVSVIKGKQNVEIRPQVNGTITEIRIGCPERRDSVYHRPGPLPGGSENGDRQCKECGS